MSKISKQGQARHRARANDYYSKMQRDDGAPAAVDLAVERRLGHGAQRRQLLRLQEQLLRELGGNSKTLLQLEELAR
ncbi:MAG: hypothetical protein DIU78_019510 [Pseudomonadota bacterium]|jgi:hypothetical protein